MDAKPARVSIRTVFAGTVALMTVALALPVGALAQSEAQLPAYQLLRFDEDWVALGDSSWTGGRPALKYIPLGTGSYASLGGELRQRTELVRNFLTSDAPEADDAFALTRVRTHLDVHLGEHFRGFVEGKHAAAHNRDLPGGARPTDRDHFELQNAFVELRSTSTARAALRVGRQELALGRQRLLSPVDWTNSRRTFDGVRGEASIAGRNVQVFWTRPVVVRQLQPNRSDEQTDFYGAAVTGAGEAWQLFALGLRQTEPIRFAELEGTHHRVTLGGQWAAGSADRFLRLDLEGGAQFGELAGKKIRAGYVATDVSHRFGDTPLTPTLTLGADYASGDGDPADETTGTFHQLFSLGHAYNGFADVLGRQNLVEARAVAEAMLHPAVRLRGAVHHFRRASTRDAAYAVSGATFVAADGRTDRHIGNEIDLTLTAQPFRHLRLEAGYLHFAPGDFLRGRPDGASPFGLAFGSATVMW